MTTKNGRFRTFATSVLHRAYWKFPRARNAQSRSSITYVEIPDFLTFPLCRAILQFMASSAHFFVRSSGNSRRLNLSDLSTPTDFRESKTLVGPPVGQQISRLFFPRAFASLRELPLQRVSQREDILFGRPHFDYGSAATKFPRFWVARMGRQSSGLSPRSGGKT